MARVARLPARSLAHSRAYSRAQTRTFSVLVGGGQGVVSVYAREPTTPSPNKDARSWSFERNLRAAHLSIHLLGGGGGRAVGRSGKTRWRMLDVADAGGW